MGKTPLVEFAMLNKQDLCGFDKQALPIALAPARLMRFCCFAHFQHCQFTGVCTEVNLERKT
jgi:hypothetical protein